MNRYDAFSVDATKSGNLLEDIFDLLCFKNPLGAGSLSAIFHADLEGG